MHRARGVLYPSSQSKRMFWSPSCSLLTLDALFQEVFLKVYSSKANQRVAEQDTTRSLGRPPDLEGDRVLDDLKGRSRVVLLHRFCDYNRRDTVLPSFLVESLLPVGPHVTEALLHLHGAEGDNRYNKSCFLCGVLHHGIKKSLTKNEDICRTINRLTYTLSSRGEDLVIETLAQRLLREHHSKRTYIPGGRETVVSLAQVNRICINVIPERSPLQHQGSGPQYHGLLLARREASLT